MLLKEIVAELRNLANEHQEISGFYTGLASEQNDSMIQYPALRVIFPYNAIVSQDDDVMSVTFTLNLMVQSVAEVTGTLSFEVETNYMSQDDTLNEIDQVLVDETELREKAMRIMATYIQGLRLLEDEYPYFVVQDGWRIVGLDRKANDFVTGCSVELTISVANDYKCLSIANPDYSVWKENINFDSPILYKNTDCTPCPDCPELSDYDFSDPLVQAELTPQQDSDLTDYLIPLADFSDPAIQALLTPTQEGDLEALLCTPPPVITQYSMSFDGVNESIQAPSNAAFDFTNVQPFTISTRFKSPTFVGNKPLMSKRNSSGATAGWVITFIGTAIHFQLVNTVTTNQIWVSVSPGLVANTWYDLDITYDGSSDANGVNIYVNTVLQTNTIFINNLSASSASGANITIGRISAGGSTYFVGSISNTRIWNIEFNQTQVNQNYNGGVMLNTPIESANLVFGWRGGTDGLYTGSTWVFPDESGTLQQSVPASVNMEYVDRTTDVPV